MSIIIMILLISFLVLVHEAGHFFAARMFKIKVSKFGFGLPIGPTLWSKKVKDVEILVHAFLLGGYVSFPDDEKDSDIPIDSQDRFANRPIYQRMVVISAGVIANIITAILLVVLTATFWGKLPSGNYDIYVNKIMAEKGESVWDSGLQNGDRIFKINNSNINSTYALNLFAQNSKAFDGKISKDTLQKVSDKIINLNPQIKNPKTIITKGIIINLPEKISEEKTLIDDNTLKGYKLFEDKQLTLNTKQISLRDQIKDKKEYISEGNTTLEDLAYAISDGKKPLEITILRNNKEIKLRPVYPNNKGIIGISLEARQVLKPTKTIKEVLTASCTYLWEQTYMLCYGLLQLFTGKIPMKDLHGIVVITKIGSDVISNSGIFSGLLLTAMISLDLALVNFLPIPALDGGHFLFLLLEKLRGKPLDENIINKVSTIFFILLILLMIIIVFNDVYALILHKL